MSRLDAALPWIVLITFLLFWEIVARGLQLPAFILPTPTATLQSLWQWRSVIAEHALLTLATTLAGFALAIVAGVLIGIVIGSSARSYRAFYPLLIAFNSVPKVAIVPILVVWFGIGSLPAAITAFLISFFPIVVNMATGIATVEPELRDVMRSLGATWIDTLRKVSIPRSLPYFFASLKIAITVAFVGSILSETVAGNGGIGHLMVSASARFDVPLMFAGLFVTAMMGVAMYGISIFFERQLTGWATRSMTNPAAETAAS